MNFEGGHHCKIIRSIGVPLGLWPYRCTILHKINGAIAVTIIVLYIVVQVVVKFRWGFLLFVRVGMLAAAFRPTYLFLHNDLSGTVKGVFNSGGYLQLAVFITHDLSIDLIVKIVNGIISPTVAVVKYFTYACHMDQVKYVFEWVQSDHDSLANKKELRLLEKSVDRGSNICNIFLYLTSALLIFIGFPLLPLFFNVGGFLNQSRSVLIPFNVEYFVDQDRYFPCIMFHIDVAVVLGTFILVVTESITVHFTAHVCGLLELTGERVERLLENSILNVLRGKTYLSIHGQLVATIQLHQRALRLIEYLNTIFIPHYCILIAMGVVSLSMNFYVVSRAILLRKITVELINAILLIMVQFFYMGGGNYIGQVMLDRGHELFMKTYCARWHAAPLPMQKILLYIRQRSMQPTGFKFGGLYTGSLELFSKLVNTSMSYFAVLYSTA